MTEARLQYQIKKALEKEGALVVKLVPPPVGIPDLIILTPESCLFIEVKTTKGKLSLRQLRYHEYLRKRNYTVIVCRSVEDAITAFQLSKESG